LRTIWAVFTDVVDREHEDLGEVGAGGAQQLQARGVAVVDAVAELAHEIHLLEARLERGEGDLLHAQGAGDHLPETPEAGDHHAVVLRVDGLVGRGLGGLSEPQPLVVQRDDQGRDGH
jgi:hypothetical protein